MNILSGAQVDFQNVDAAVVYVEEFMRKYPGGYSRTASVTDPSDTDLQHDQTGNFENHLLDPDSQLYKGDKGRQPITQEMKTHLGASDIGDQWGPGNPYMFEGKIPNAACEKCGGWTNYGGMSHHFKDKVPTKENLGRPGCSCAMAKAFPSVFTPPGYVDLEDPSGAEVKKLIDKFEPKGSLLDRWLSRRSDKAVEQKIINLEKDHLEPGEVREELRSRGVPERVVDETYENREKNLFKTVELGS